MKPVPYWIITELQDKFDMTQIQLGGSRRLGGATENSDWDFTYAYSTEIEDVLLNNGYRDVFDFKYSVNWSPYERAYCNTVTVYEKVLEEGTIQINLVQNVDIYNRIVQIMQTTELAELHQKFNQDDRIVFWDTMYKLLGGVSKDLPF